MKGISLSGSIRQPSLIYHKPFRDINAKPDTSCQKTQNQTPVVQSLINPGLVKNFNHLFIVKQGFFAMYLRFKEKKFVIIYNLIEPQFSYKPLFNGK